MSDQDEYRELAKQLVTEKKKVSPEPSVAQIEDIKEQSKVKRQNKDLKSHLIKLREDK